MDKTIKTLALIATGWVIGVAVKRVNGAHNRKGYLDIDLEKANLESVIGAYQHYANHSD